MVLQAIGEDEPFAFDENPAAFDRTQSAGRKSGTQFNPEEREEDERIYREAILRFVEDKRLEDVLGQGEIASLEKNVRIRVLMKGMLPNIVHLFQRSSRADTKLGVLVLIHFCADNADGLCRLSVKRFAQILNRKEENLRLAIKDLEEGGEIGVYHNATGNSYWPIIDRVVRDTNPALGWFIDTFSDKPSPFGRPQKAPPQTGKGTPAVVLHRNFSEASNKRGKKKERARVRATNTQPQVNGAML